MLLERRSGLGLGGAASVVLLIASVDVLVLFSVAAASGTVALAHTGFIDAEARAVISSLLAIGIVGFFGGLTLLRAPIALGPLERLRALSVFAALRTTPLARLAELVVIRTCFVSSFIGLGAAAFYAFDVRPPTAELLVGMVVVGVVAALPIAIAGLGTGQIAFKELFGAYGSPETLVAMSLALSVGMILLRAGMGVVVAREFTREALRETRASREEST